MTDDKPAEVPLTPMLRQYLEIKEQYPDAILFYRIGDFYEMFYDDAVQASKVLDIVLTSRNKNDPNPVPLCGVPHHAMEPYLEKLVSHGFKVAICDQVEDPKSAKGVVRREVTRVVTPGMAGCLENMSTSARVHYLAALCPGDGLWGLARLEISTGDFRVTEVSGSRENVLEELRRMEPREVLVPEEWNEDGWRLGECFCLTRYPRWLLDPVSARKVLCDQFSVATLSGFGCEDFTAGIGAAAALMHYATRMQKVPRLAHVTALRRYGRAERMVMGEESRRNLNLDELIDCVDRTRTSPGRRKLRDWYYAPLLDIAEIGRRQDCVAELMERHPLAEGIRKSLEGVYDIERINSRLSLGSAHARDLKALVQTLEALQRLVPLLGDCSSELLKNLHGSWDVFSDLREALSATLVEDPPLSLKEGGLIRDGVDETLDGYRHLRGDARGAIAAIEDRERRRTGISSLKVHFNRVFGYYLEVSAANLAKVPPDFIRKQTLANAERFVTPELKALEEKILGAEERIKTLEYEIYARLRDRALSEVPQLQTQADRVAVLDTLVSLAAYARESRCVRPLVDESHVLEVKGGRHPLVEKNLPPGTYVPTHLSMDASGEASCERLLMITGPNMAGKSTAIRQTGVLAVMAQTGSFVPADSLRLGIVDQLFTRVGASDRLARGESTFMVEMCETANILHHATQRSLVLLDEIGRGTSTFDGISIAWAVAEYFHDRIGCRTLFATHYHELIDMALTKPGIRNYNVEVRNEGGNVVFLYRLVPGGMSHSYGIHVARLAGLPSEVVDRAREVLQNLEQGELDPAGAPRLGKKRKKSDSQMTLL